MFSRRSADQRRRLSSCLSGTPVPSPHLPDQRSLGVLIVRMATGSSTCYLGSTTTAHTDFVWSILSTGVVKGKKLFCVAILLLSVCAEGRHPVSDRATSAYSMAVWRHGLRPTDTLITRYLLRGSFRGTVMQPIILPFSPVQECRPNSASALAIRMRPEVLRKCKSTFPGASPLDSRASTPAVDDCC